MTPLATAFAPFNGEGVFVSFVRLVIGGIALVHVLLCLKLLLMRAWRRWTEDWVPEADRLPSVAFVAYAAFAANAARGLLLRIPGSPPLVTEAIVAYAIGVIFGSLALVQITRLRHRQHRRFV